LTCPVPVSAAPWPCGRLRRWVMWSSWVACVFLRKPIWRRRREVWGGN